MPEAVARVVEDLVAHECNGREMRVDPRAVVRIKPVEQVIAAQRGDGGSEIGFSHGLLTMDVVTRTQAPGRTKIMPKHAGSVT